MIRRPPRSPLFPYPPLSRSVVESGHYRAAVRVDDLRVGSPPLRDLVVRADGSNPVAGNGERLVQAAAVRRVDGAVEDRKSTRLNSSHSQISYAVFCLKKKST